MIYRELKRTWKYKEANYIPKFKEVFPELKKVDSEELCDRFIELKMDFYYENPTPVKFWVRLTLPLAMITYLLMYLMLPVNFIITGNWGYSLKNTRLFNWFKSVRLIS